MYSLSFLIVSMSCSLLMLIECITGLELILTRVTRKNASTFLDVTSMSVFQSKLASTARTHKRLGSMDSVVMLLKLTKINYN